MTLPRPVLALPLAPSVVALLTGAGFTTAPDDFADVTASSLGTELGMSADDAAEILRVAHGGPVSMADNGSSLAPPALAQTASQLLHRPPSAAQPPASTLSRAVDALLSLPHAFEQGLRQGAVMELSGPPGIGKTACAIGLALDVRRRAIERGDRNGGSEVLLVDTEGGIPFDRLVKAADMVADDSPTLDGDDLLDSVSAMRVTSLAQLVGFFRSLPRYMSAHPLTKLIVVDSLSYHLRAPNVGPDKQTRGRVLQTVKDEAQRCAYQHGCTFVFVVQMATKFIGEDGVPGGFGAEGGDRAVLAAQLGDAWLPKGSYRLQIAYAGGTASAPVVRRIATLLSGPSAAIPGAIGRSAFAPPSQSFGTSQGGGGSSTGRRAEFAIREGLMTDVVRPETDEA